MMKVCQVRLIKVDLLALENKKLLNVEGRRGKYYLDGFVPHEFVKLTNLISRYGGTVVSPDEETIILSESEVPSDIQRFPRFHVNWLHDSLRERKLQDIGKYLLMKNSETPPRALPVSSFANEKIPKKFEPLIPISRSLSNRDSWTRNFQEKKLDIEHLDASKSDNSGNSHVEENLSPNVYERNRTSDGTVRESHKRSLQLAQGKKEKKVRNQQKRKKHAFSSGPGKDLWENGKKRKKLMYKQFNSSHSSFEYNENHSVLKEPEDSKNCANYSSISGSPLAEFGDDSPDHNVRGSIVEVIVDTDLSDQEVNLNPMGEASCKQNEKVSPEVKKRLHTKRHYSYEENMKIFQYLIDNDFLSQTNSHYVWEQMAASEAFQDPPRNASGLRQHFDRVILPRYVEYTTDPDVIAQLAKRENRKLKNIIRYFKTEENGDQSDSY
ncbi:uncharacterized protein [Fopius arisanus]|uniref:BRCT domain-containing protein n=2 Tax=Fopius arisanus TaxID=64838 RepID=A0A9R1TMB8_9HYME|nr:PREDICTED: uncharacterized protein LOC105271770 [Fopius arisanus]